MTLTVNVNEANKWIRNVQNGHHSVNTDEHITINLPLMLEWEARITCMIYS